MPASYVRLQYFASAKVVIVPKYSLLFRTMTLKNKSKLPRISQHLLV
jgi:hypothetical protein